MTGPALLFTVVIPLFNKEKHIKATLASVAAQTFKEFELIVVDDGSTDGGVAIVEGWNDPRLRLVRQSNGGPGLARNRGIDHACGEWIAFMDADDVWLPNHLLTLAETIAAYPSADLVGAGYVRARAEEAFQDMEAGRPEIIEFFEKHHRIWTSASAVRSSVLQVEKFGEIWPGEDVELWTRLALQHTFAVHSRRTAVYVQDTGGAMDRQASCASSVPIDRQPLFATIDAALARDDLADRRPVIARFRNKLMLEYARPSLASGQAILARRYLSALREGGGRAPLCYQLLALLPGPLVRQAYFIIKDLRRNWRRLTSKH